jgi:hypothetical protein
MLTMMQLFAVGVNRDMSAPGVVYLQPDPTKYFIAVLFLLVSLLQFLLSAVSQVYLLPSR